MPSPERKAACYSAVDQGKRETPFRLEMTAGERGRWQAGPCLPSEDKREEGLGEAVMCLGGCTGRVLTHPSPLSFLPLPSEVPCWAKLPWREMCAWDFRTQFPSEMSVCSAVRFHSVIVTPRRGHFGSSRLF